MSTEASGIAASPMCGKRDGHARATASCVRHTDRAAVGLDDRLADGEPDPRGCPGADERVEDLGREVWLDALAVVDDVEAGGAAVRRRAHRDAALVGRVPHRVL